jgi:DNA-binding response OmpR family regulator
VASRGRIDEGRVRVARAAAVEPRSRSTAVSSSLAHDYAGTERAIDHMLVRLRRKLGRHGARIETVFGIGYRWRRASR